MKRGHVIRQKKSASKFYDSEDEDEDLYKKANLVKRFKQIQQNIAKPLASKVDNIYASRMHLGEIPTMICDEEYSDFEGDSS